MIKAAVLGSPISHSLSPILHRTAYQLLEVEGEYQAIDVTSDTFNSFLNRSQGEGWNAFSLTMPLKEQLFDVDFPIQFDEIATSIRSANTLFDLQGSPRATSTDFSAFQRLLTPLIAPGTSVAILGGGGTARAALGAIATKNPDVSVYLRGGAESPRAVELRALFPHVTLRFLEFGESLFDAEIVINTTPKGAADLYANPAIAGSQSLFESLYYPWPTEIARAALEHGVHIISGKELLIEQAMDQIALMTGKSFDFEVMREKLREVI